MFGVINIYSKSSNEIGQKLSNFYPHTFVFEGIEFNSFEAFLQSLKFSDVDEQLAITRMNAKEAKEAGKKREWQKSGWLYWQGQPINRFEKGYQELLERAYDSLCENSEFANALRSSRGRILIHTIGKLRKKDTVLTSIEFCKILTRMRRKLK